MSGRLSALLARLARLDPRRIARHLDAVRAEVETLRRTAALHAAQIADFAAREAELHRRADETLARRARALLDLVEGQALRALDDARKEILLRPALRLAAAGRDDDVLPTSLMASSRAWQPCPALADIEWPVLLDAAKVAPKRRVLVYGPGFWRERHPVSAINLVPLLVGCAGDLGFALAAERAEGPLLAVLRDLPEAGFAAAVLRFLPDHLPPRLWPELFDRIARALKPDAPLVLAHGAVEPDGAPTPGFWRDPAALRPLPEPVRDALLAGSGFGREAAFRVTAPDGAPVAVVIARKTVPDAFVA